jgi:sodium/potassium/calcium exchanger 6
MDRHAILKTTQQWRRSRYSARPFALTILAITLISLLAWAKTQAGTGAPSSASLHKRDVTILDEECRLVHHAHDQCAFVRANCPDEEAGVVSYLTLYYCRLPHAKPVAFVLMTLWLALLFSTIGIAASDFFCINLNTIARMLGMSESLAGVTLLAFGNGSPDVFSTFAAFRTHAASLAVGELIGAACFITAVVSGSMALIRPFQVARKSFVRDVGFFLVAATFSLGFIIDGKLHLWEAISMVAFYLFYVVFVVSWHWWLNLRKERRLKAAAMRNQYVMPNGEEEEVPEYHDEETSAHSRTPSHGISIEDFSMLENAGGDERMIDDDDNEEERERWMGELTNNMRVNRPNMSRRNTHTPIRPSLVGALEFRAVLSSLQKSRNIQSMPINLRRYSDDPTYTTAQQQKYISQATDTAVQPPFDAHSSASDALAQVSRPSLDINYGLASRTRAVSTNDIDNLLLQSSALQRQDVPDITLATATPNQTETMLNAPPSPTISLSPPNSPSFHGSSSNPSRTRPTSSNRLAPPSSDNRSLIRQGTSSPSPFSSPVIEAGDRQSPPSLTLVVPNGSSPPIPFPAYTDYPWSAQSASRPASLRPPSPSASSESGYFPRNPFGLFDQARIPRWWPSNLLPTPHVLVTTLFPTLTNWSSKSFFDKVLGLVASVPVFLLTITLPVVEPQQDEKEADHAELSLDFGLPTSPSTHIGSMDSYARSVSAALPPGRPENVSFSKDNRPSNLPLPQANRNSFTTTTNHSPQVCITGAGALAQSPEQIPALAAPSEPKHWNRWLVIVQIFTAPFFIVLILWANMEPDNPRVLLRHTLYSLIASLCVLALILLTTSPTRPPHWRSALCFLGFAVAIAWISTIANEVVGVLRTLGVILNMSDAILGLTIFAVGNSLGDLVADITVARLGFPIMALSACFGGPMLNILLGVGLSGCYMVISKGEHQHEKHPDQSVHFKPYHIAVSTTLVISGATLLLTLAGLLIAVPLRKWKMDKVIGWGLVTLWFLSTVINVLVEVLGYSSNVS